MCLSGSTPNEELAMKNVVFCRTTDEVNSDLARCWCDECELTLQLADPRDELFPASASGVAFDLNHLVMESIERPQFVQSLHMLLLPYPVAVASYDLDSGAVGALQARGVLVFRRLDCELFRELANAIRRRERGDVAA
jgi:hypothetical protein